MQVSGNGEASSISPSQRLEDACIRVEKAAEKLEKAIR
jgi:hypothetical protein